MSSSQTKIFIIPEKFRGHRLDNALVAIIPEMSRNRLTNWLKSGDILVNNNLARAKDKVTGGEVVHISPPIIQEVWNEAEEMPLNIIYEDSNIIVINKPANLTVHPGSGNFNGTLLNGLLHHYKELQLIPRAGIVHRLDKDTTGLMVVARTLASQNNLVKQLQARTVERIYHALAYGHVAKEGIINKNIGRDPRHRTKMAVLDTGGKEAVTHYKVLQYFSGFSYIECKLETGRTHQIRVHLQSIGHSIVGDPVYAKMNAKHSKEVLEAIKQLHRQALHAYQLSLIHPTSGKTMTWTAPIPDDMAHLLQELRATAPMLK